MAKKAKAKSKHTIKRKPVAAQKAAVSAGKSKGIGYWKIIGDSLKFSFSLDKVLLFYLVALPALLLLMWLGNNLINLGNSISELSNPTPSVAVIGAIAGPVVLLVGYFIIMIFLQTLLRIAVVENANAYASGNKKSIFESIKAVHKRFWPAFGAILLMAVIIVVFSSILGIIPFIGVILSNLSSAFLSLAFLLLLPDHLIERRPIHALHIPGGTPGKVQQVNPGKSPVGHVQ